MTVKVWINGVLEDARQARVSVFDHGVLVGDGVFETIKSVHGRPFALTRHLERLARSAAGLGLPEPDLDAIRDGTRAVVGSAPDWPLGRIRVTFTSGSGPLGSDRGAEGTTTVVATQEQQPLPPVTDVSVVPWPRNERGALTGIKTTSYGDNVRAFAYAKARSAGEAIFANLAGNLCEGTGSNVFVVVGGSVITPPLSAGCLPGVTRDLVLEWYGGEEADLPIEEFAGCEEAFLTSTTRNVQPIRAVDGAVFPAVPGPATRKAMEVFAQRAAAGIDP